KNSREYYDVQLVFLSNIQKDQQPQKPKIKSMNKVITSKESAVNEFLTVVKFDKNFSIPRYKTFDTNSDGTILGVCQNESNTETVIRSENNEEITFDTVLKTTCQVNEDEYLCYEVYNFDERRKQPGYNNRAVICKNLRTETVEAFIMREKITIGGSTKNLITKEIKSKLLFKTNDNNNGELKSNFFIKEKYTMILFIVVLVLLLIVIILIAIIIRNKVEKSETGSENDKTEI
ncbi:MAG: hypothetical protein MHPSP_001680, partial [Paramarteilia canceri]